eukprot:4571626-Pleurochrysis_carterae.AAC.1
MRFHIGFHIDIRALWHRHSRSVEVALLRRDGVAHCISRWEWPRQANGLASEFSTSRLSPAHPASRCVRCVCVLRAPGAFGDFEAFKAMMLACKAGKACETQGGGPLCVVGAVAPLHMEDMEEGEEMAVRRRLAPRARTHTHTHARRLPLFLQMPPPPDTYTHLHMLFTPFCFHLAFLPLLSSFFA